jgi:hypothetical protein
MIGGINPVEFDGIRTGAAMLWRNLFRANSPQLETGGIGRDGTYENS